MTTQPHDQHDPYHEVLVSPRYLAGSDGSGEAGFAPVAHWPHHHLDEGPCQLLVTSPDQRIRIGWFGDDFDLWKISAAEEAVAAPRWTATFNHVAPAEIVAGLTNALAQDYAASDPDEGNGRFLAHPSMYWADAARPLTDAGWTRSGAAERGTVEIIAPDGQAGILIDRRRSGWDDEVFTLWSGPPGWGTRAEATFTARTPSHLIAATAAAMTDPTPVIRVRRHLDPQLRDLATLTPVRPADTQVPLALQVPRAPTPLDVRRTAVTRAVHRAARLPRTATDLRVMAARNRTDLSRRHQPNPVPALRTGPQSSSSSPRRSH
ncbi:DUF317 domain-containing protein [Streptomyces acidiscabies]|uniref:DUF317 domain-containing protein n=1 Tax=Streptomyces acidiscabies TaxID=42234 RepID=UPI00095C4BDD|nr:DUF317 domain-containing protein [Streptomyces acidiscabies]GAV38248.1 hypothetical protein Saa2_01127 [Streptomyces acidiscabies]